MKAVLISIRPKWCELIANGEKTIEVRKTVPKLDTPFKCYIYETQGKTETPWVDEDGHEIYKGRGQVVGEFMCDKVIMSFVGYKKLHNSITNEKVAGYHDLLFGSCLSLDELMNYGQYKTLFGWHISNLIIYDKPKELSEFYVECKALCFACDKSIIVTEGGFDGECYCKCLYNNDYGQKKPLTRPPQSWCYVKE